MLSSYPVKDGRDTGFKPNKLRMNGVLISGVHLSHSMKFRTWLADSGTLATRGIEYITLIPINLVRKKR